MNHTANRDGTRKWGTPQHPLKRTVAYWYTEDLYGQKPQRLLATGDVIKGRGNAWMVQRPFDTARDQGERFCADHGLRETYTGTEAVALLLAGMYAHLFSRNDLERHPGPRCLTGPYVPERMTA